MKINAMEPKLKRTFLIPVVLTNHFFLVTFIESATSGCCVRCSGMWNTQKPPLVDIQEKQVIDPHLTRNRGLRGCLWGKLVFDSSNLVFDSQIPKQS